ncbi:hypothetical protein AURDEDRAFT_162194 [Auricularia subglabra TFB-10046 SS5]|nr:hypothetical protein AURDEDRAFT_162194 [Auricularia subglabra TFB-10046 SS5]
MNANDITFSCPYCARRLADIDELRLHTNFGRPTPCKKCGKPFGCINAVLDHADATHRCTCGRGSAAGVCGVHGRRG